MTMKSEGSVLSSYYFLLIYMREPFMEQKEKYLFIVACRDPIQLPLPTTS